MDNHTNSLKLVALSSSFTTIAGMSAPSALTPESPIIERMPAIVARLYERHPDFHCELNYETPVQLLFATILSAQTTDARVNQVTPALFAAYPDAAALAAAPRREIERLIRPTGFFRQKARFLQESAHLLETKHDGKLPATMPELIALPGVARKTANVALGEIYGIAEGVVVDTHVKRLSNRLGITVHHDPKKVERDLMALLPKSEWINISHLLIFHGRRICFARRPNCADCNLTDLCPAAEALPPEIS